MTNKLELGLFDEEARRATYKHWIFKSDKPCSADKMAEAGFIFTGSSREPDSAQCFFCKKALDGWEAKDDPWSEHVKHATYCDFAMMQKPQDSWTLNEFLELWTKYQEKLITRRCEDVKKQIKKQFDVCREAVANAAHF